MGDARDEDADESREQTTETDQDDEGWLLERERGRDVSHVPLARREAYERLQAHIAKLPDAEPRPGWEDEVRSAIEREEQARAVRAANKALSRRQRSATRAKVRAATLLVMLLVGLVAMVAREADAVSCSVVAVSVAGILVVTLGPGRRP